MENKSNLTFDQSRAVYHDDGNLLISASAGSGKTYVMISRIINLILSGKAGVDEILAVTYTKLAAEEMKQKLVKEVVSAINSGKDRERLVVALSEIPNADISTFHSFLTKVLRSHFYAVGIDPLFKIADETDAEALKKRAIDRLFDEKYNSGDEEFLYLTRIFRRYRSDGHLKETVMRIYEFASSEAEPDKFLSSAKEVSEEKYDAFERNLIDIYKRKLLSLQTLAEKFIGDAKFFGVNAYAEYAENILTSIKISLSATDAHKLHLSADVSFDRLPQIRGKDETTEKLSADLSRIRKALTDIYADISATFSQSDAKEKYLKTGRATEALCLLAIEYGDYYDKVKKDEGLLDFSDLEHLSYKLLCENETIREEIKNKYKYIFADEYQDVNGVQEAILNLISSDNVFMVGDVKQSIYAFRGCNPDIFAAKFDDYSKGNGGSALFLDKNFRSASEVLDSVNGVFSRVMTKDFGSVDYGANPMIGGDVIPSGIGGATLHIIEGEKVKKEKASGVYSVLKAYEERDEDEDFYEGILTAEIIEEELKNQIYDGKLKAYRQVTLSDIAVLSRDSSAFTNRLLKELAKLGVPATSETKTAICDYPEIKILISVLELIAYYADDVPLATVLKSSIGNLTEAELAEIRRPFPRSAKDAKTFSECVNAYINVGENEEVKTKLVAFKKYFEKIRLLSEFCGAGEILTQIMEETGLDLEILGMPFGAIRLERAEKFISESVKGGKILSVTEFLNRIRSAPDKICISAKSGSDTVRVMSMHASKGLEFPIVIIVGAKKRFSSEDLKGEILLNRSEGISIKYYDEAAKTCEETLARKYFKEVGKLNRVKEEARVFYVAMTRAQNRLHIVCDCPIADEMDDFTILNADKFADFLSKKNFKTVYHDRSKLFSGEKSEIKKILIGIGDEGLTEKILSDISYSYPYIEECSLPVKRTVTKIAEESRPTPTYDEDKFYLTEKSSFIEKGNAYHKFMQYCDFSAKNANNELIRLLSQNVLSESEAAMLSIEPLEKVLSLEIFEALKSYELYREQPFIVPIAANEAGAWQSDREILVQGVIDLLAVKGDEAIIIDYKTSSHGKEQLKRDYAAQLNVYALAVEKALKLKVKEKLIINLLSGEVVEI